MLSIQPTNYNRQINFKSQKADLGKIAAQIEALTPGDSIEVKDKNILPRCVPHLNDLSGKFRRIFSKPIIQFMSLIMLMSSTVSSLTYILKKSSVKEVIEQLENQISLNKQKEANQVKLLTEPTSKQQFIDAMQETYTDKNRLFKDNQVPIYIQELRKARMKLYEQLPAKDKIVAYEIEKYILSKTDKNKELIAKINESEDLQKLLGIDNVASNDSVKIDSSIIKMGSLAIIDALRNMKKDGHSILTGASSDKLFNEACKEILEQYSDNDPESQIVAKKVMNLITTTRDRIEKDMTPEEKKIYQEKYNQYVKKLNAPKYKKLDKTKNFGFDDMLLGYCPFIVLISAMIGVILMILKRRAIDDVFDD